MVCAVHMASEEILRHLRWYLATEPTPPGRLENEFGESQSPANLYPKGPKQGSDKSTHPVYFADQFRLKHYPTAPLAGPQQVDIPTAPAFPAKNQSEKGIDVIIDYLAGEIEDKRLKERSAMWKEMKLLKCDDRSSGLLRRRDSEGLEAMDTYVSWIVAALRDFPYLSMPEGREEGIYIRDEIIAKVFEDRWDFYNNKKLKLGLFKVILLFSTMNKASFRDDFFFIFFQVT